MFKVLMMSQPGGDRGPAVGYKNHIQALKNSKNFIIDEFINLKNEEELKGFDYFWFYARFYPKHYYYLKQNFPNKKIICGPNILFENAKSIPKDDWENWFMQNAEPDVSINVAQYYVDYVKLHYKRAKMYKCLEYCASPSSPEITKRSEIDFLVYKKKRRYDHDHEEIFNSVLQYLKEKSDLKIETVAYGSHQREEFLKLLEKTKFVVWTSIDDYCSLAQLECIERGVPVIGTPHNCTIKSSEKLLVKGVSKISKEKFVEWEESGVVANGFIKKLEELSSLSQKEYQEIVDEVIEKFNSTYYNDSYSKRVERLLTCL
jgi:hypothetical protein